MTTIALVIFIIFILYVMVWSIKNDGARSIGEQTGFIKMRDPSAAPRASDKRGRPRRTGPATRRASKLRE